MRGPIGALDLAPALHLLDGLLERLDDAHGPRNAGRHHELVLATLALAPERVVARLADDEEPRSA